MLDFVRYVNKAYACHVTGGQVPQILGKSEMRDIVMTHNYLLSLILKITIMGTFEAC